METGLVSRPLQALLLAAILALPLCALAGDTETEERPELVTDRPDQTVITSIRDRTQSTSA